MNKAYLSYYLSKKILAILLLCFCSIYVNAQRVSRVAGNIIVQYASLADGSPKAIVVDYLGSSLELIPSKEISRTNNLWLIEFDESQLNANILKNAIEATSKVQLSQFDFHLDTRANYPDDPLFASQWAWLDESLNGNLNTGLVDAPQAWDISTGGLTVHGDTIVLALVDDGIDLQHPDLVNNLWKNTAEIPDNGIDDDYNGYVDDVHGWNAIAGLDYVGFGSHGAQVAGVMGASGNNAVGISGINWNIAIMPIVAQSMVVSEIIAGYDYALQQRLIWNESNGALGAFVVGLNTSWGIDNAWAIDAPLWCEFYNTMGQAGIVSCSAVSNNNQNIDEFGDLPGTCPSDYQITVTATNQMDIRDFAAYGLEHVDVAAPGFNIFTTQIGNNYGYASGTSFATPALTGLVGLLYASPCEYLINLAKIDPQSAAAYVKNVILQNIDTIPDLQNEILSGGRMNANQSLIHLVNNCETCFAPSQIEIANIDFQNISVTWSTLDNQSIDLCYREANSNDWNTLVNVQSGLIINDLAGCTSYEMKLIGHCEDENTATSSSIIFETEGCCHPPSTFAFLNTPTNTVLNWEPIANASGYIIQYRQSGTQEWTELVSLSPFLNFNNLPPCTNFEVRFQTLCGGPYSEYSEIFPFSSENCETCSDLAYCPSIATNATFEWIESISLNGHTHISGTNYGFGDYTNGLHFQDLEVGVTNNINVEFGYSNVTFPESVSVWIDFNQDGYFTNDEKVSSNIENVIDSAAFNFVIPMDALTGITRMRVSMEFDGNPVACGEFNFGEVEDYCVNITNTGNGNNEGCFEEIVMNTVEAQKTLIELSWSENTAINNYIVKWSNIALPVPSFDSIVVTSPSAIIPDLLPCESYQFIIKANCDNNQSNMSEVMVIDMECDVSVDATASKSDVFIYPNPFNDQLSIESDNPIESIQLIDVHGRIIAEQVLPSLPRQVLFNAPQLQSLTKGVYWIQIKTNGVISTQKVVHF